MSTAQTMTIKNETVVFMIPIAANIIDRIIIGAREYWIGAFMLARTAIIKKDTASIMTRPPTVVFPPNNSLEITLTIFTNEKSTAILNSS